MSGQLVGGLIRHAPAPLGAPVGGQQLSPICRNNWWGGRGCIAGQALVNGVPGVRELRLMDASHGMLLDTTISGADGMYRFDNLNPAGRYTVIEHDHTHAHNAAIADNITPALLP